MDYKDYIREEYCDVYVQERDNLEDRLIEAKYNLLFLKMVHERSEFYRNNHNITEKFEIMVIMRRIYVTVAWELALQIKAFTNDNAKDSLTINKLQNKICQYIKPEKKEEYKNLIRPITKASAWKNCIKIVSNISDYRNKIVGHNIINTPELTFDINEADFVISQYEDLFKVLSFQNKRYAERVTDLNNEKANFITIFLDALLPQH